MAAGGYSVSEERYLKRYKNMREARISFMNQNCPENHTFMCELYTQDTRAPYNAEVFDISHRDQAISSHDAMCTSDGTVNVIFVAQTENTSTMSQMTLLVGEGRMCGPGGYICSNDSMYDYIDSNRRTFVERHCINPSAFSVKITQVTDTFPSCTRDLGMIQLVTSSCARPEVVVEFSTDTDNIVKALVLTYAVKLAYLEYKLHELTTPASTQNVPALTSQFQSLSVDVPPDFNAYRQVIRPEARRPLVCPSRRPTGSAAPSGPCDLRLNTRQEAAAYSRGYDTGYVAGYEAASGGAVGGIPDDECPPSAFRRCN
ncbi:hypothetical protein EB796_007377 [Bugula neritina]|uniref:Uncharacterized protein n=1 Tax=Bugula neritina TaxID=10212 RepID=A0A7J7K8Q2_BUGNE|nr:hypothetical protein EB796_007377 [Bugula neritina]